MGLLSILGIVEKVIDNVVPDPDKKLELKLELAKLADAEAERQHKELIAQSEVNKVEAGHRSIFVAGWRPAIGWGCGAALVYNTLIAPAFGLGVADLGFLQTVLLGMLGLAGARTYEKVRGVAEGAIRPPAAPAEVKPKKKVLGVEWPF